VRGGGLSSPACPLHMKQTIGEVSEGYLGNRAFLPALVLKHLIGLAFLVCFLL
jgi:hypothetical protein